MKFASIVISADLAEALYQNGIRNDAIFYWFQDKAPQGQTLFETGISQKTMPWKLHIGRPTKESRNVYKEYAAFTSQELGDILPAFLKKEGIVYFLRFYRLQKEWQYVYEDHNSKKLAETLGKTEAEARGAMLNYLFWNKLITLAEII